MHFHEARPRIAMTARRLLSQQARNFAFELDEREVPARYLIRDRDSKFSGSFDEVFATEGVQVILIN